MYKKVLVFLAAVIILGLLAAGGIVIYEKIAEKYRESEVQADLVSYYNVPDGEAMLIIDEKINEKNALFREGEPYIELAMVKDYYTNLFTWCPEEGKVYFTTPSTEYIITPDAKEMLVDGMEVVNSVPIIITNADELYVAMSFLLNHSNITYHVYENPARVLVTYSTDEYLCAKVKEESAIRVSQDIKADYLKKIPAGESLRIIEGGGIQQKGFIKVMSSDGVRGYFLIEKLDWDNRYNEAPSFNAYTPEVAEHNLMKEKIYLAWQLVYSEDKTAEMIENITANPEINVVSPTWFFMNSTNGSIQSYATKEYVDAAHERNVKVWALLKNDIIDGKFNGEEDTHKVLASYDARKKLISNVIKQVKECGADGINVDLETHKVETGVYFVQFLRELSIECRKNGIVLSVDNYIPEDYNAFYNIPEQAKIVDYVIIMAYDEHYQGSDAGSISSLNWFIRSMDLSLSKCEKEQIIMGLPFYTRLWKEIPNGDSVRTITERIMSLKQSEEYVSGLDFEPDWDEDAGQYYYESEVEDGKYRLWLEDKKSLMQKVLSVREYDMAGLAAWKMGDETEGIWAVLKDTFEGEIPLDDVEVPEEISGDGEDNENEGDIMP